MPKAFTSDHIEHWRAALNVRPEPIAEQEAPAFPSAESFTVMDLETGAAVRIRTQQGETLDFQLNPVVAWGLALDLAKAGRAKGWLTEDGEIEGPDVPLQS